MIAFPKAQQQKSLSNLDVDFEIVYTIPLNF